MELKGVKIMEIYTSSKDIINIKIVCEEMYGKYPRLFFELEDNIKISFPLSQSVLDKLIYLVNSSEINGSRYHNLEVDYSDLFSQLKEFTKKTIALKNKDASLKIDFEGYRININVKDNEHYNCVICSNIIKPYQKCFFINKYEAFCINCRDELVNNEDSETSIKLKKLLRINSRIIDIKMGEANLPTTETDKYIEIYEDMSVREKGYRYLFSPKDKSIIRIVYLKEKEQSTKKITIDTYISDMLYELEDPYFLKYIDGIKKMIGISINNKNIDKKIKNKED